MKINLTFNEMTELVRKSLGLPASQWLEISITSPEVNLTAVLLRQICREFPAYLTTQKIVAIKALRDRGPQKFDTAYGGYRSAIGLADAKWAIENPDDAVDNLEKYGQIRFA